MSTIVRKKIRKNGREISIGGGKILVMKIPDLRLPTGAEWQSERLSWSTNNAAGAFNSPLKLTMAGRRTLGLISSAGTRGYYWTSAISGSGSINLTFLTDSAFPDSNVRALAYSIRLIRDRKFTQLEFDNIAGHTVIINGLIYGYCYNPTTQRVWLDRNLGATQIATSSTDTDAYGHLFQWGRYSDGHEVRTSDLHDGETLGLATTEQPNQGNDWDGKFITNDINPKDWLTPQNDDLWQGVNGINNPAN